MRPSDLNPYALKLRLAADGRIEASLSNLAKVLRYPEICGYAIKYVCHDDEHGIRLFYADEKAWRTHTPHDVFRLRLRLERLGFQPITKELMQEVLDFVMSDAEELLLGSGGLADDLA